MTPEVEVIDQVQQRLREIAETNPADIIRDRQELEERESAAQAYAVEDEGHFVDYCQDSIRLSVEANREIRADQGSLYRMYKEDMPPNFANKENWQSKAVIPKPHSSVQFAMSAVRKAFTPDFLSIANKNNPDYGELWEKLLKDQLGRDKANFPIRFTDSTGMGFAVGVSMEMIPTWVPGSGLRYEIVEPWKIHRDPDAVSRLSQSGLYWIHQEYIDYHVLLQGEKSGRYINVKRAKNQTEVPKDNNMTEEEIAKRKGKSFTRGKYRHALLTSEFWGTVLDRRGELLLPDATYTIAGNNVIGLPKLPPFSNHRWPGTAFSPLPDFVRFEGRGLLKGVQSIWYLMCSVLALYTDNLNWVVNPMTEIEQTSLVDTDDIDSYPGKQYLTRGTISGNQAVRTVERRAKTADVMSALKFLHESFQEGNFISDALRGSIGKREITAREASQNLDQAMGVFGLMGDNTEDGAIQAIKVGADVTANNISLEELSDVFGEEVASQFIDGESDTGITLPPIDGEYSVSGLSAILKDNEAVLAIREVFLQLGPEYQPYLKHFKLLKSLEQRVNLKDEGIVVTEDEAEEINERTKAQQQQVADAEVQAIQQKTEEDTQLFEEKMAKIDKEMALIDVQMAKTLEEPEKTKNV